MLPSKNHKIGSLRDVPSLPNIATAVFNEIRSEGSIGSNENYIQFSVLKHFCANVFSLVFYDKDRKKSL